MTHNTNGGPRGLGVFLDAASTVADFNKLLAIVAEVGNNRLGSTAERDALPAAKLYDGLRWYNTSTRGVDECWGGVWVSYRGRAADTFGADGNMNVESSKVLRDERGVVDIQATVLRTNSTTFVNSRILGIVPAGFRPSTDWFGRAFTYGIGTPMDFFISSADGVCTLTGPSPDGHVRARLQARYVI